ncbi:MAG: HAMP domain-containing histidine kinase [Bdellovibrionales bacterium]|nr:HAMP domain-containing histidine kinase [Bdellovibrionales bacterium]
MIKGENIDSARIIDLARKGVTMGKHLASLQTVLMDLTSISLGKLEIKKEKMDMVVVATEAVALSREISRTPNEFNFIAPAVLICEADPIRMSQVITNLVNNAIKYGAGSPIGISIVDEGEFARVSVSDSGPGIPPEKHALIFERFERATDDTGLSGFGLGLYVSQQIVQAHNGKLSLESKLNFGSTFTMRIPVSS